MVASALARPWRLGVVDRDARPSSPWTRDDTLILAGILILALATRALAFGRLGLSHFDESIYALAARHLAEGRLDGDLFLRLPLFAPPLFYATVALVMWLLVPSATAHLSTGIALGTLGVGAVYVVGRDWFGRRAALFAAVWLALSDFHIVFSRTGLTDTLFAALFLLALWQFGRSMEDASLRAAIIAGILTGLAWNTKYHGWLAIPIAGIAASLRLFDEPPERVLRMLARIAVGAAVAVLMFLPWVLYLREQPGGFGGVIANHREFLDPLQAWDNVSRQLGAAMLIEGWLTRLTAAGLLVLLAAVSTRLGSARRFLLLALAAMALGVGALAALAVLAVVGGAALLVRQREWSARWLPLVFLGAFVVATPLYHAYSRLMLPVLIGALLLAGYGLAVVTAGAASRAATGPAHHSRLETAGALAVLSLTGTSLALRGPPSPGATWAPTDGLQLASAQLAERLPRRFPTAVVGEPAVVFYLETRGFQASLVRPRQLFDRLTEGDTVSLIDGLYSRRIKGPLSIAGWRQRYPDAFTDEGVVPVGSVGEVRMLDDFLPADVKARRGRPVAKDYDLHIYQLVVPRAAQRTAGRATSRD